MDIAGFKCSYHFQDFLLEIFLIKVSYENEYAIGEFGELEVEVTVLKLGDILTFHHTGAYCMSEGIALFLTRDIPSGRK